MPIHDLLYRCPLCDSETTTSLSNQTSCLGCKTIFSNSVDSQILVQPQREPAYLTSAHMLNLSMKQLLKVRFDCVSNPDQFLLRSESIMAIASEYQPIYSKKELMGYTEVVRGGTAGHLILSNSLEFVEKKGVLHHWDFEQIKSLQISSDAIQLYMQEKGLHQFKLIENSPKLWEDNLKLAISRCYLKQNLEIISYQPVIKTRRIKI
jgi:hypothetical protein